MMIRFRTLLEWIRQFRENSRLRRLAKRKAELEEVAYNVLQIREFSGKLFVCYRDIPVIEQSQLDCPVEKAVREARIVFIEYFKHTATKTYSRQ